MSTVEGNLGLAARARKIVSGSVLMEAIRNKRVSLVLVASDASDRSKKQFQDKCTFYQIPCLIWGTIHQISAATGTNMRVAVGINDHGLAKNILECLK
ncbi:MAG: ribosomal L7Ae/L30e/S12e/Gadd45 family protein [Erysipelothrix sp.]|nr:ribosomal L7Ae/L30e/S12e/Gadd45 family protein [Erysipelothrix sp.]